MDAKHVDVYDVIQGYEVDDECIETETMWYLSMVWTAMSNQKPYIVTHSSLRYERSSIFQPHIHRGRHSFY